MSELIKVKAGTRVYVDSWHGCKWSHLVEPSDYDKEYFGDRISFRLPSGTLLNISYAVRVEVTGRTRQWKFGESMVRGKITWLKDETGEPEETSSCWLTVYD